MNKPINHWPFPVDETPLKDKQKPKKVKTLKVYRVLGDKLLIVVAFDKRSAERLYRNRAACPITGDHIGQRRFGLERIKGLTGEGEERLIYV